MRSRARQKLVLGAASDSRSGAAGNDDGGGVGGDEDGDRTRDSSSSTDAAVEKREWNGEQLVGLKPGHHVGPYRLQVCLCVCVYVCQLRWCGCLTHRQTIRQIHRQTAHAHHSPRRRHVLKPRLPCCLFLLTCSCFSCSSCCFFFIGKRFIVLFSVKYCRMQYVLPCLLLL